MAPVMIATIFERSMDPWVFEDKVNSCMGRLRRTQHQGRRAAKPLPYLAIDGGRRASASSMPGH
jgi:hypothetical protein